MDQNYANLNPQQLAILNWRKTRTGSANIVARAGCGKTTSLIALVQDIVANTDSNVFLGAYNKAIAAEISARLKALNIDWRRAEAGTMHSVGFRLWRRAASGVKVEEKKVHMIIDALATREGGIYLEAAPQIRAAVSLAKQSGFGWVHAVDNEPEWFNLFEHYGIELDEGLPLGEAVRACIAVLRESHRTDREVVDFDDMISAPIVHNLIVRYPYDFVLIDEAQDTNVARRTLALRLMKPRTGRMVAVGDDRQAIYGFTGADSNAMELIRRELNSTVLPLNVTYRCPKLIVAEAQKLVPDITAHASAPEGELKHEAYDGFDFSRFEKTDAVLCRNTAPLIELAYRLIGKKVPCRVEGRDIGKSLEKLARRWKVRSLEVLLGRLEKYLEREIAKWTAKGREERAAAVEDQVESLRALIGVCMAEQKYHLEDLVELIGRMFGDTPQGEPQRMLTLSTVHKSKGREWERVFILRAREFMPSRWARKEWQQEQEQNLIYVAITRAKRTLIYLD